jgi:cytochrome c553
MAQKIAEYQETQRAINSAATAIYSKSRTPARWSTVKSVRQAGANSGSKRLAEPKGFVSAQGFRGFYPIPRLAGQQPTYLENQLQAFIEHRRTNNVMFNVAHSLSPSMVAALAANFNALNPPPLGGAPRQLVVTGGKIFQDGLPDQDIAACAACHGPDAAGAGLIPRLAGQLYPYVIDKLVNWGKERGQNPKLPDTSAIMTPVAHSLNKSQIEAVAAYVSTLK